MRACAALGGGAHLAVPLDVDELAALEVLSLTRRRWVGLHDIKDEAERNVLSFATVTGEPMTDNLPFLSGEPNAAGANQDCIRLDFDDDGIGFADFRCEVRFAFVCELPDEPRGCTRDDDCNNELACDGVETCVADICVAGPLPCGARECEEPPDSNGSARCLSCDNDGDCRDGSFCDGPEVCFPNGDCVEGAPEVCAADAVCVNDGDCGAAGRCVDGTCELAGWLLGEPNNASTGGPSGAEDCMEIFRFSAQSQFGFNDADCALTTRHFLCTARPAPDALRAGEFFISANQVDFATAVRQCENAGGILPSIRKADALDAVAEVVNMLAPAWIGGVRQGPGSDFIWTDDGSPVAPPLETP